MSDLITNWIRSDEIILVITDVQGRPNIQTVILRNGPTCQVQAFEDHPSEHAGPTSIISRTADTSVVVAELKDRKTVTIESPVSVDICWTYEIIRGKPIKTINNIKITNKSGKEVFLSSENSAYPVSLLLKLDDSPD